MPNRRGSLIWCIFVPHWIAFVVVLLGFWFFPINYNSIMNSDGPGDHLEHTTISRIDIVRKKDLSTYKVVTEVANEVFQRRKNEWANKVGDASSYNDTTQDHGPSRYYESVRRHIYTTAHEMWYFANGQISDIQESLLDETSPIWDISNKMLKMFGEFKRSLIFDINELAEVDGYLAWRHDENAKLTYSVQKRLHHIQNPKDCRKAKKLACKFEPTQCGFGCQLHHLVDCLILAYATQRTLVLTSQTFIEGGDTVSWNDFFLPLSDTCLNISPEEPGISWHQDAEYSDVQVIWYPYSYTLREFKPRYLPLSLPEDLVKRLVRIHGDPIVWWVGQFLKYLLRPNTALRQHLAKYEQKIGFQKPIVGIQVRRGDKVASRRAGKFNLEEYMFHIEEYYKQVNMTLNPVTQKRIYVATDEPEIFKELELKYPDYEILGDPGISLSAKPEQRNSKVSVQGIITDIHFLSRTNYLVCTFSSRICRISYEIMNHLNYDASQQCHSLDSFYFYAGAVRKRRFQDAVMDHEAMDDKEISFKKGSVVELHRDYRNGYSRGKSFVSPGIGFYPSFKAVYEIEYLAFPSSYSHISEDIEDELE